MKRAAAARTSRSDDQQGDPSLLATSTSAGSAASDARQQGIRVRNKSKHRSKKRQRRSRRYTSENDENEPFVVLFAKVGVCVFIGSLILWHGLVKHVFPTIPTSSEDYADDDASMTYADDDGGGGGGGGMQQVDSLWGIRGALVPADPPTPPPQPPTAKPTLPPFPVFEIDSVSASDTYGLAALLEEDLESRNDNGNANAPTIEQVKRAASELREEFATRYGGENAARYILQTATSTFHSLPSNRTDTDQSNIKRIPMATRKLARRLLQAKESNRPFKISFAGYSVTVGRGNLFSQSYPFLIERLLAEPIQLLGIPSLDVRNAALGGAPSFPYGWCLDNFLGWDADVVSWDYSMNEAGGVAEGLESYLRHALAMKQSPMLLVKDTHTAKPRTQMLQAYAEMGVALDTLVVHTDPASEPFLALNEDILPLGFQDWRSFGAPLGAPGQAPHHPATREHEFIGWIIVMHFLSAIDLAAYCIYRPQSHICRGMEIDLGRSSLPPPTVANDDATIPSNLYSLFYGSPVGNDDEENSSTWTMNRVSCHTSFEPSLGGDLTDVIVGGIAANSEGLDIMLPKGAQFYNSGWVLDLGDAEKKAKRKLERYGGLGFIDKKKAYYGVNASGTLEMFLPLEESATENTAVADLDQGVGARKIVHALVVCEVNEKRGDSECNMERDVAFVVGGTVVNPGDVHLIQFGSASYLGKSICVHVGIPNGAVIRTNSNGRFGLTLGISVRSRKISIKEGACSVSHVVYQRAS